MKARFAGPLLLMLTVFLMCSGFVGGCKRPPAVEEGAALRKAAYVNVSENKTKILETLIEFYRDSEYETIDLKISVALETDYAAIRKNAAATGGTVQADQAIEGMKKISATREAERAELRAKVDARIREVRFIIDKADNDLIIANKLNDVLDEYDRAGVDVSAAKKAAAEIMGLLKPKK